MNSINLGTITIPIIKGEKGDKPIKGVDYWTEEDQVRIVNDVEQTYNVNHEAKIAEYNENASEQINEFNGFVTLKTEEFDENATLKTTDFDSNASDKTTLFNTNATNKTDDFNDNATDKTTTFNENVTSKTTEFNELVEDKEDEIEAINNTLTPRVESLESGMSNYYKKTETYSKTEIDNKVSSVYRYKGTVSTYADLPVSDLTVGDVYNVETADSTHGVKAGDNVSWNGTVWDVLAGTVDLSGYQTKIDNSHKLASDLVDDTNSGNKFVTTSEKQIWNGQYTKPSGGIPSTDLSSAVQTSLGKADTAVQDVSGKEDKSNKVTSINSSSTDTQYPSAKLLYDQLIEKQAEIDGLVSENTAFKKQFPTAHISTTSTQLTDSADGMTIENVKIKGATSQVQYTGKNLANIHKIANLTNQYFSRQIVGETIVLSNNTNSSGYLTTEKKLSQICPNLKVNDVVKLSFNTTTTTSQPTNAIYLTGANELWYINGIKTITQEMLDSTVILYGGYNETAVISEFMIRLSSVTDSTYEPYVRTDKQVQTQITNKIFTLLVERIM